MHEPPEWVHVWYWLRFVRDPQVMTAMPQQEYFAPKPLPMSMELYESYRTEWVDAGSPKAKTERIMQAMGINPLVLTGNPILDA